MKSAEPTVFKSCAQAVQAKSSDDGRKYFRYSSGKKSVWCLASTELQATRAIADSLGIRAVKQNQADVIKAMSSEIVDFAKSAMEANDAGEGVHQKAKDSPDEDGDGVDSGE